METEKVTRQELFEQSKSFHQQLINVLERIPVEDYLLPNVVGDWSIKDTLAHLTSWEQMMITWLGQAANGQLPDMPTSDEAVETLNADMYQRNKALPVDEVLAAFKRSYTQALAAAENASDELLFTPNPMEGRENPFWITVAANMWWHYKEHYEDLSRWLEEKSA